MDINQIKALITEGESLHREFKTSTTQLKPAIQTISAFLNGKGGAVLIGVKNDGQIIGQDVTDKTRLEIANELKKIEPTAQIDVNYITIPNGKSIIILDTVFGRHAPYVYDGRPYERIESSTVQMSQHRYEQLLVRRGQLNHAWEEELAEGYDIGSLDHEEIRRTIKEGIDQNRIGVEVLNYSLEDILRTLKLLKEGHLINAGAVLYAKNVELKYSNCMIRLARFKGTDKLGDYIDNQRVYGNAFRLISAGLEFAQRHLPIASFFKPDQMQRIDQPAVPALALREALINAVSHRDYLTRAVSIALAIYDDRLEVWNNGLLPPRLKIEDLKKPHQSFPRNEEIATIFYKRGWVEGWGTGTTRMVGYCQKNGTPEPEFQEYSGGFSVTFRFNEPMGGTLKQSEIEYPQLNTRQARILQVLPHDTLFTSKEIFKLLGREIPLRTIQSDLLVLKNVDLIEQIGKGRSAAWKTKH